MIALERLIYELQVCLNEVAHTDMVLTPPLCQCPVFLHKYVSQPLVTFASPGTSLLTLDLNYDALLGHLQGTPGRSAFSLAQNASQLLERMAIGRGQKDQGSRAALEAAVAQQPSPMRWVNQQPLTAASQPPTTALQLPTAALQPPSTAQQPLPPAELLARTSQLRKLQQPDVLPLSDSTLAPGISQRGHGVLVEAVPEAPAGRGTAPGRSLSKRCEAVVGKV